MRLGLSLRVLENFFDREQLAALWLHVEFTFQYSVLAHGDLEQERSAQLETLSPSHVGKMLFIFGLQSVQTRSLSQAATCPLDYLTRWRYHTVPFKC